MLTFLEYVVWCANKMEILIIQKVCHLIFINLLLENLYNIVTLEVC